VADLFEEVEEQLRSDRYRKLLLRALPWTIALVAAAVIAVLAYWGWSNYRQKQIDTASEQYAQALQSLGDGRADEAARLFAEVSRSAPPAYKALALIQLGGLELGKKQTAAAVKRFDDAAAVAPDDVIGDAARLKSAFALLDTAPRKELEGRLTPLMQDGRPYRVQAREALAFSKLMAGDLAAARGDFTVISGMLDAPEGARARAKAAIGLIDSGSAKAVAQIAHAAAALPPSALAPPPGQPQEPGPQ
jgi:hypothetical protein